MDVNLPWIHYLPGFIRRKLEERHHLQKVIGNTGWLMADKVIRLGVGLVVSIAVLRFLGPDRFGMFSYAFAFSALFSIFATLGLDGIIVQELVRTPEMGDEILGTAFVLKLGGGAFAFAAAVVAILLLRPADATAHLLVMIAAAGTVFQSFDVIDYWFQARVESVFTVYARMFAFLLVSAFRVVLIVKHAPLSAFAWAASLELILGAVGLVMVYRYSGRHVLAWRTNTARIRKLLSDGWPLALGGVAVMIYMKIDQVMLGQMLDSSAVGIYSAATRISEVWYFIPMAIVVSVSPSLIEAKKVNDALYYQRLSNLFRLMSALALAIAIPMTFLSGTVASLLYGNRYDGVGPVLAVHIWAALFVFLGVAQSTWNIVEGLTRLALIRTSLGAVANILLNLLWIPRYGAMGAAIATTVSYALSAVVFNAFSARTRRVFKLQMMSIIPFIPAASIK